MKTTKPFAIHREFEQHFHSQLWFRNSSGPALGLKNNIQDLLPPEEEDLLLLEEFSQKKKIFFFQKKKMSELMGWYRGGCPN